MEPKNNDKKIAVVQIRGIIGTNPKVRQTIKFLNLGRKHNCVIVSATPNYLGMLKVVKDYVTYGEVSDETIKLLEKKNKSNKTYNLSPPKGGFERKGIKKSFAVGGALGERGEKINDLIKRMI